MAFINLSFNYSHLYRVRKVAREAKKVEKEEKAERRANRKRLRLNQLPPPLPLKTIWMTFSVMMTPRLRLLPQKL